MIKNENGQIILNDADEIICKQLYDEIIQDKKARDTIKSKQQEDNNTEPLESFLKKSMENKGWIYKNGTPHYPALYHAAGISKSCWSTLINRSSKPSLDKLLRIIIALELNYDDAWKFLSYWIDPTGAGATVKCVLEVIRDCFANGNQPNSETLKTEFIFRYNNDNKGKIKNIYKNSTDN